MNAINLGITRERIGAVAQAAVFDEGERLLRGRAAERLAEEMDQAARLYGKIAERLGLVLESAKMRRRAAWNWGTRQRVQPPTG